MAGFVKQGRAINELHTNLACKLTRLQSEVARGDNNAAIDAMGHDKPVQFTDDWHSNASRSPMLTLNKKALAFGTDRQIDASISPGALPFFHGPTTAAK
jgi:hypothetical protein